MQRLLRQAQAFVKKLPPPLPQVENLFEICQLSGYCHEARHVYPEDVSVKVVEVKRVLGKGSLAPSPEWQRIRETVVEAVRRVDWPPGSGRFTINPTKHGNGVNPIQKRAASLLNEGGWQAQYPWPIADRRQPGRMDAAYAASHGLVAFEWETGNVASCHRSINKICLGFHIGAIAGGILAVSSNRLYPYLTDRVGNIGEIERYFPLWAATPCDQGVLEIIVVEHDATSSEAPLIPKGREGWARLSANLR